MFGKKKKSLQDNGQAAQGLQKGDRIIAVDRHHAFKVVHDLTESQRQWFDTSTLWFERGKSVFMHYFQDGVVEKRDDPQWQNQMIFFWRSDEAFPKKSLPPFFEAFKRRYFSFKTADLGEVRCISGQTAPWFGQPGGGEKFYCEKDGQMLTVTELYHMQLIEYLELIPLHEITPEMLRDRDHYCFLAADSLEFTDGYPSIGGKVVPISRVYQMGLCALVKRA